MAAKTTISQVCPDLPPSRLVIFRVASSSPTNGDNFNNNDSPMVTKESTAHHNEQFHSRLSELDVVVTVPFENAVVKRGDDPLTTCNHSSHDSIGFSLNLHV